MTVTTFKTTDDAFLSESEPDTNYGGGTELRLSNRGTIGNRRKRTYLQFDISRIPLTAIVESAELSLYYHAEADRDLEVRPVATHLLPFDEMAITWNDRPALYDVRAYHYAPYSPGWIRIDVTEIFYLGSYCGFRIRQINDIERTTEENLLGPYFRSKEYMEALSAALTVIYAEIEPGIPTELTISAPASAAADELFAVSGDLWRTDTGEPLPDQPVNLSYDGISLGSTTTNAGGHYQLEASIPVAGVWTLKAEFPGTPGYLPSTTRAGTVIAASPIATVLFTLSPIIAGSLLHFGMHARGRALWRA